MAMNTIKSLPPSILHERSMGGMRLLTAHYTPGTERVRSRCPDGQFWLMLRGGWTTHRSGQSPVESDAMSLGFHLPGEQNRQRVGREGAWLFGVQIPYALLQNERFAPTLPTQPTLQHGGRSVGLATRMMVAFSCEDSASTLIVEELIPELLRATNGQEAFKKGREPRWLATVISLLHDRVSEPLTLKEISAECDLHPVYLSAAFRRAKGCTLGEYLRGIRIEAALRPLTSTDREIGQIALEAGFYDQAHFCRVFKAQVGVSPSRFRQITHHPITYYFPQRKS